MTEQELIQNRDRLIECEKMLFDRCAHDGGLHIELGSGDRIRPGFVAVDTGATIPGIVNDDIVALTIAKSGSVDTLFSAHSLEHVSHRHVRQALRRWLEVLKPSGDLYLSMPDLRLCAQQYCMARTQMELDWWRYTIYGYQAHMDDPPETEEYVSGQCHLSGYTLTEMEQMLTDIGYEIMTSYNYDGYKTLSFFIHARRRPK